MNATLPLVLVKALAPMAPPSSVVHKILSEQQRQDLDASMLRIKQDYPAYLQRMADKLTREEARLAFKGGAL